MSGSKQTTTQQSQSNPWAPAQPVLNDILGRTQDLSQNTANFTPIVGDTSRQAVTALKDVAAQPSAAVGALGNVVSGSGAGYGTGLDTLMATAGGDMIGRNPAFEEALNNASTRTANLVNQQFSGAGRYGSGAHTGTLTDRIGQMQAQARTDQYNKDRTEQMNAAGLLANQGFQGAGLAGALDQAKLFGANLLGQAGTAEDAWANAARMAPMNAVDWARGGTVPIAGLGGQSSGTSTTRTPANIPGMIGGGLMAGLGAMTGNPMMVAGGLGGFTNGMSGSQQPLFGLPKLFG